MEAGLYPGDLLKSVQSVDETFWESNPNLRKELNELIEGLETEVKKVSVLDKTEQGVGKQITLRP